VEAGKSPIKTDRFEQGQEFYRPHTIDFDQPPSREEFLAVTRQFPWMAVWQDTLFPIVAENPWPMIDLAHKAAHVDLHDEQGQIVGKLEVTREERWANEGYSAPFITTAMIRSVTRLNHRKTQAAVEHVESHLNTIMERVAQQAGWTDETVKAEIRKVLVEGGFLRDAGRVPPGRRENE